MRTFVTKYSWTECDKLHRNILQDIKWFSIYLKQMYIIFTKILQKNYMAITKIFLND